MPVAANVMGLVVLSLGILGIIISFLITDKKKYGIAMVLSLLIVALGAYQYVSLGVKQWQTQRKITKLQEQQRMNLQALQERLRQGETARPGTAKPAAPKK
jgi:hypothetical protein